MRRSFWKLFVAVSALGAVALALVVEGAKRGAPGAVAGGVLLGIAAAGGVVALGRIVAVMTGPREDE